MLAGQAGNPPLGDRDAWRGEDAHVSDVVCLADLRILGRSRRGTVRLEEGMVELRRTCKKRSRALRRLAVSEAEQMHFGLLQRMTLCWKVVARRRPPLHSQQPPICLAGEEFC